MSCQLLTNVVDPREIGNAAPKPAGAAAVPPRLTAIRNELERSFETPLTIVDVENEAATGAEATRGQLCRRTGSISAVKSLFEAFLVFSPAKIRCWPWQILCPDIKRTVTSPSGYFSPSHSTSRRALRVPRANSWLVAGPDRELGDRRVSVVAVAPALLG